jgi:hypothetical protein
MVERMLFIHTGVLREFWDIRYNSIGSQFAAFAVSG